jgi:phosphoribosylglycinamide formyltransferase-1
MYGHHVHEAVIAAGETESGCTVHLATHEYDKGPVVIQKRVPVLPDDTPEMLADRVFEAELQAYPEAIRIMAKRLGK